MKHALTILALAFALPSFAPAIELEAERDCRARLWQDRVGALVSFSVAHPAGDLSALNGVLSGVTNDVLDFGTFMVRADRVIEKSVVRPKKDDLMIMYASGDNGHVAQFVAIFDRVIGRTLKTQSMSVPLGFLVGQLTVVRPGARVFVEYTQGLAGYPDAPVVRDFTTYTGHSGKTLYFNQDPVALDHILRLQLSRY